MTLSNVFGGFKGAITKKLAKEGLEENFDDLIGMVNRKRKKNRLSYIKKYLVEQLGFDENSRTVKEITIDERGRVGYYDKEIRDEAQDAFNIEKYKFPPGTKVNRDAIKNWIKAKGIGLSDLRSQELKDRRDAESTENIWAKQEDILNRLSFAIVEKFEREGYEMPINNRHYEEVVSERIGEEYKKNNPDFTMNFEGKDITWNKGQV